MALPRRGDSIARPRTPAEMREYSLKTYYVKDFQKVSAIAESCIIATKSSKTGLQNKP
jgi:hypothetical protein